MAKSKEIKEAINNTDTSNQLKVSEKTLLSTGSTLLNLACSNNIAGGFLKGHYHFLVGDSSSGKTFLSMTCFAEAANNKHFKDYRLIYDNVEDGCLLDVEKFFGKKTAERVEAPAYEDDAPVSSQTIEEFYYNISDIIEQDKPFIYVLDSMDALSSSAEQEKFDEQKKASRKGNKTAGSYGDGKAKMNSSGLRKVLSGLKATGSILIILNQTRDNIGFGFEKKTRSGGHALKFYATLEMWSSVKGKITKTIDKAKRQIGIKSLIKIKKNRITGRDLEVEIPIYHSYGFDDIGSCVTWLVDEGHWNTKGSKIAATEFDQILTESKLIIWIEENDKEQELKEIVGSVWAKIEEACKLKRKKRYE